MLMTMMKTIAIALALFSVSLFAHGALAHGFELQQNAYVNPTAFSLFSNQPYLDNTDNPTPAPAGWNLFTDAFDSSTTIDTLGNNPTNAASYGTDEGFVQQVAGLNGSAPIASATFKILSPLYYSDGTGSAAQPAAPGSYLQIYDAVFGQYPGASQLPSLGGPYVNVTGSTPSAAGFSVSAEYFHELQKDLYLGAGSTQTFGEYGFAFDVTVSLLNPFTFEPMTTLTTAPMVDVFALTDPTLGFDAESNPNGGDFVDDASQSQQDAATTFLYDAALSAADPVPEPSAFVLAVLCCGICGVASVLQAPRQASRNGASVVVE